MCLRCDGWTEEEIHDWYLEKIRTTGWAISGLRAGEHDPGFAYTIGLTRFHGHPELLVSGLPPDNSVTVLNSFAALVREGNRFAAGRLLRRRGGGRYQFVRVEEPNHLIEAQGMYAGENGLVPALQVIYTNAADRWPWDGR